MNYTQGLMKTDKNLKKNSHEVLAARVLLGMINHGPYINRVARAMKVQTGKIEKIWSNFKENGFFEKPGKVSVGDYSNKKSGGVAVWCDVAGGLGWLKRT